MLLLDLVLFVLFSIVLVKSSTITVRSLIKIAHYLKLNEFVVSFIVFGIASALPETFISISSGIRHLPEIGMAVLIGGNIVDLTLIIGVVAIYARNIKIKSNIFRWDMFYLLLCGLPLLLMLDGTLSRIDGAILVIFFILYFNFIILNKEKYKAKVENHVTKKQLHKEVIWFTVGILLLVFSANTIVDITSKLALDIAVPYIIVSLLLIALVTTLPEFTFSIRSINQGHKELGLGDILGVVIVDATVVLGVLALINPITNISPLLIISAIIMFITSIITILLMESDSSLDYKEGIALIIIYVLFLIFASNYRAFI